MKRFAPFAAAVAMACATAMQSGPGAATSPAITAQDLRTRLYIFADDSMMGRQFGTEGNLKGTQYIANELARMGVQPGGTGGTYFQDVPAFRVAPVRSAQIFVDGAPLTLGTDFITSFKVSGNNVVEKPEYENGNVYFNSTQCFEDVPEIAWNFYIGGYQPAQKWLKDRKGRKLSYDDIQHTKKSSSP